MASDMKVGIIGLDTSHTIQFARLIQGDDAPEGMHVSGMKVVKAMRFPSAFHSEPDQDKRQQQLEKWGIPVTRSFADAVAGVDALMLEINDPALHLDYFRQAVETGKPIFLDKPLAATLAEGKTILALAKEKGVKFWSASSLRFSAPLQAVKAEIQQPTICSVYGPLGKAPAGSSLVWYGVHAVEMLTTLMGCGARNIWAQRDELGVVLLIAYDGGRRGIVECNEQVWFYGGRAQNKEKIRPFSEDGKTLYFNLLSKVRDFFHTGESPVPLQETLEVQAILNATDRSLQSGREESIER